MDPAVGELPTIGGAARCRRGASPGAALPGRPGERHLPRHPRALQREPVDTARGSIPTSRPWSTPPPPLGATGLWLEIRSAGVNRPRHGVGGIGHRRRCGRRVPPPRPPSRRVLPRRPGTGPIDRLPVERSAPDRARPHARGPCRDRGSLADGGRLRLATTGGGVRARGDRRRPDHPSRSAVARRATRGTATAATTSTWNSPGRCGSTWRRARPRG